MKQLRQWLAKPRVVWVAAALGVFLTLPTLWGGLYFDDYILRFSNRVWNNYVPDGFTNRQQDQITIDHGARFPQMLFSQLKNNILVMDRLLKTGGEYAAM